MSKSDFVLPTATVVTDSAGHIRSADYDDIYYSSADGPAEKSHVFLAQNRLKERWESLAGTESGCFCIVETGFGTGLNFLLAADLWVHTAPATHTLHYYSIEQHPLERAEFEASCTGWSISESIEQILIEGYPEPVKGRHRIWLTNNLCLTLVYDDVRDAIRELQPGVDAWFLDGFDPKKNPAMWTDELWPELARLSQPGSTIATYTVAGNVRRGLARAGFKVSKVTGFGKKRESLKAIKTPGQQSFAIPIRRSKQPNVAILGGGLAGTTCAHLLALRGVPVTLFERLDHLLSAASGMYQLAYYPQLSMAYDPFTSFSLQAFQYLQSYLKRPEFNRVQGNRTDGFLKLADRESSSERRIARQFEDCPEIIHRVTAAEASELAGVELKKNGCFYPHGGWLDPRTLGIAQSGHPSLAHLLKVKRTNPISRVIASDNGWTLYDPNGNSSGEFSDVVVATGIQSRNLSQLRNLPLTPVRGQTAVLTTNGLLSRLRLVLADGVGVFPCMDGQHGLSATYTPDSEHDNSTSADQDWLLNRLDEIFEDTSWQTTAARVGIRCVSKDRHPVVGLVPDWNEVRAHYAPLAKNARQTVKAFHGSQKGLYVCTAFGSHGLTHIPLCADYLASLICDEPGPLTAESEAVLSPNRFLIRDMKKQTIKI